MEVTKESFDLKKIKRTKDGGLEIVYAITQTIAGVPNVIEATKKDSRSPHPDLTALVEKLKEPLLIVYRFGKKESEFITVNGISLSGKDKNFGGVIMGTLKAKSKQVMSINSHRLNFSHTTYGYEEDLLKTVEDLTNEVFEYLFKEKQAAVTMGLE